MRIVVSATKFGPDKNDVVLQELLDGGNWRQALANLEKRLKKSQDDRLVLNKALVLLSSEDGFKRQQGMLEIHKMVNREPPIVDLDILNGIDQGEMVSHIGKDALASMWERAQRAESHNKLISSAWLNASFKRENYLAAQKAALKAMTLSEDKRRHFFHAVACAHLACERLRGSITEDDHNNAESLAFKFLSAAAKRVTSDDNFVDAFGSLSLSGKQTLLTEQGSRPINSTSTALQKPRDLRFLIYVFRKQGRNTEALSVLNDESRTGLRSAVAAGSWELLIEKVKLLDVCTKWEGLWNLCHSILLDAARDQSGDSDVPTYSYGSIGDDFAIWRGLARAAANIGTEQIVSKARDAFEGLTSLNARYRFLGRLEFELHPLNPAADKSDLLASLFGYQNEFRATPSNFRDISSFMARIPTSEKRTFLRESETYARDIAPGAQDSQEALFIKWVRSEINSLKLDYNLVVSSKPNLSEVPLLESFAANCLRIYQISLRLELDMPITDRRCGDDAAILAAMTCIHLAHQGQSHALLKSISILENLLVHSKHNYDAIILLIRLYVYLGAVSKAFELCYRLDIKNVQTQTLSWILLTRISTLHPHASTKKRCDPLALLQEYINWSLNKAAISSTFMDRHLESDNAMALCENAKVIGLLLESFPLVTMTMECLRISRSRGDKEILPLKSLASIIRNKHWPDIRDSAAVASYEHHGQPVIDQYIRPGPVPSMLWARLRFYLYEMRSGLEAEAKEGSMEALFQNWPDFEDYFEGPYETNLRASSELTDIEFEAGVTVILLRRALTSMAHVLALKTAVSRGGKDEVSQLLSWIGTTEQHVQTAVRHLDTATMDTSCWREIAERPRSIFESRGWEFFHDFYIEREIGELYVYFLQLLISFSIALKDLAPDLPPKQAQPTSLNDTERWRERLNTTVRGRSKINCDARKTADMLQRTYNSFECVTEMRQNILGSDNAEESSSELRAVLERCLDKGFVERCCRELAESWVDCLEGFIG